MCFSAMVEQNAKSLADQFGAGISWAHINTSLKQQVLFPEKIKTAGKMKEFLANQKLNTESKDLISQILAKESLSLNSELEKISGEIYDLDYELAKKHSVTKAKKRESKIRQKKKLEDKQNKSSFKNFEPEDSFIFPHWKLFAIFKNERDQELQVSDFSYGHFRNTGILLEDILYHIGKHPRSPKYSLYNSKVESLSPEYFSSTRSHLQKISEQRKLNAELFIKDYKNKKGLFSGGLKDKLQDFLDLYQIPEENLEGIKPKKESYMETLFPKQKAVVCAKAFREMVLKSDYYKNKAIEKDKHIAVDFYQEEDIYFPALYSEQQLGKFSHRGLSIITTEPRPEVLEKGHDRSPITLCKQGATAYLTENISPNQIFELFSYYQLTTPFHSKPA